MQSDFQSVVVKRINYKLPCYNNVLHLRITEYLEYLLFNLHKIWGKIFCHPVVDFPCLLCKPWPLSKTKAKAVFYSPGKSPRWVNCTSHNRIWSWIMNRIFTIVSFTFLLQKEKKLISLWLVISLDLPLYKIILFIGSWNKLVQSSLLNNLSGERE